MAMILAHSIVIFTERHIEDVMLSVLDSPMFPGVGEIILCFSIVASNIVPEFLAVLSPLPALPMHNGYPLCIFPVIQTSDPIEFVQYDTRTSLLASVPFAIFRMAAGVACRSRSLCMLVEKSLDIFKQMGLIILDGQDVIRVLLSDLLRNLFLTSDGVNRDNRSLQV